MGTIKRIFLALLLAVGLSADVQALPPVNGWKWVQLLDYYNSQASTASAGCMFWIEEYGTGNYRLWKRCGVSTTSSGTVRESLTLNGWSGTPPDDTGYTPSPNSGIMCTLANTTAFGCSASGGPGFGGTNYHLNSFVTNFSVDSSAHTISAPGQDTYEKIVSSCTGARITGSLGPGSYSSVVGTYQWFVGQNMAGVKYSNTGTVSSTCRAADVLIQDFGSVPTDCTTSGGVVEGNVRGYRVIAGSCSCIPRNKDITYVGAGNVCTFENVVGDPALFAASTVTSGAAVSESGYTWTNTDLSNLPSGVVGLPVTGDEAGVMPSGQGSGPTGHAGSPGPTSGTIDGSGNATGSSPVTGNPTGSGGGSGSGSCTHTNCNDDGTEDLGSVPGVPTFDSTISGQPTEDSPTWVEQVQSFASSSPIVSTITGSGITASGDCALSASVMGASVDLGFCNIPSSFFTIMSAALLLVAHMVAFFIIFK